jgi:hypothetical protein
MKKNGKYRFTLQFPNESEVQKTVGDFLERMGNRKSALIVQALWEYLQNHPEHAAGQLLPCPVPLALSRNELRTLIGDILKEQLSPTPPQALIPSSSDSSPPIPESAIDSMLSNLDLFQ